jgi:ABC-2 type transport system ATP-binding protein
MDPAIRLENVKKILGKIEVLKGISFAVEKGDIFGYLGSNGAGKTTTIRVLLDLIHADSGEAYIGDQRTTRDEARRRVGFVLDADGLYNNMTAGENLEFYSQIYGVPRSEARIDRLLEIVGLRDRIQDQAGTFSTGMRQRLALARAMVHDPETLILDEPMSGIDPSGQIELRQIMLDLVHTQNKTIFLSSHDLDEVQRICNRIALIDRGEIVLYGELENLRREIGQGGVVIETAQDVPALLLQELAGLPRLGFQSRQERRLVFSPPAETDVSEIVAFLVERGVGIEGVKRQETSLEDMYAAILKAREGAA